MLVAIAGAESSFGKYQPSQAIHNPFGMGPNIKYGSYQEAIAALAQNLAQNYMKQGLNTIPEIAGKYAPSGAANDPNNLNSNWTKNVSKFYADLGGDPEVAAETARYTAAAADMEQKFGAIDTGPALALQGIQDRAKQLADMMIPKPVQLTPIEGTTLQPLGPSKGREQSDQLVSVMLQKKLVERMSQTAASAGLSFELDHGNVLSANAPAFVGSAAEYVKQNPTVGALIQQGESFLGTPYKWGGSTPQTGFDCSGFAQWLYGQQGINLPRTTYEQIKSGLAVGLKDLEPGDLVFFGSKGDPHHEGIYIGNGQFIHAPHTGDVVKISSLTDGYYRQHFVTGRRVTN